MAYWTGNGNSLKQYRLFHLLSWIDFKYSIKFVGNLTTYICILCYVKWKQLLWQIHYSFFNAE